MYLKNSKVEIILDQDLSSGDDSDEDAIKYWTITCLPFTLGSITRSKSIRSDKVYYRINVVLFDHMQEHTRTFDTFEECVKWLEEFIEKN